MWVVRSYLMSMTNAPQRMRTAILCGLGLLAAQPSLCGAQYADITPFKLLGVEGDLSARYNLDDYEQTSAGGDKTYQTRPTFEEEISIPVSYTHLTLPTNVSMCSSRWWGWR